MATWNIDIDTEHVIVFGNYVIIYCLPDEGLGKSYELCLIPSNNVCVNCRKKLESLDFARLIERLRKL